ncbi:gamma-glutamyl-gamma-aminobutyrate hydrolase family protein [Streptosporangium sp. NPDC002544]|uniref:gamma-glutamyl-gamma-aminobutyrate hydrolase family protein n=1 Tax=unclassified Streptosporangium TaxID=2632669 RepID=UPI003324EED8
MVAHPSRPVIGLTYSSTDLERFSLWRNMLHGFAEAGAVTLTIDCHQPHDDIAAVVRRLDGLVVSGGADVDPAAYGADPGDPAIRDIDPIRDRNEQAALRAALDAGLPVLAICRGLQLVNVTLGGTLYADLNRDLAGEVAHELREEALAWPLHMVDVTPGSRLSQWLGGTSGRLAVNSEHHQGVRRLADGLVATAVADDGLVEGAELRDHPLVAVQWHPEILWPNEEHALQLLSGFVDACRTDPAAGQSVSAGAGVTTVVTD